MSKKGGRDLSQFNYGAMSSLVVNQGQFSSFIESVKLTLRTYRSLSCEERRTYRCS